jgi:hypothetical protein
MKWTLNQTVYIVTIVLYTCCSVMTWRSWCSTWRVRDLGFRQKEWVDEESSEGRKRNLEKRNEGESRTKLQSVCQVRALRALKTTLKKYESELYSESSSVEHLEVLWFPWVMSEIFRRGALRRNAREIPTGLFSATINVYSQNERIQIQSNPVITTSV